MFRVSTRVLEIGLIAIVAFAAVGIRAADKGYGFGGYVKLDAMYSDYGDGDLPANSPLRDFHIPGAIPVGGVAEDAAIDFHAKESRLNFEAFRTEGDHRIKAYFEIDFLLGIQGDERVSNSYDPRLRHAYLSYDNWLFGQTWSTFMIVVLPEDLDFVGVAEGTTFRRGPQIRYSRGHFQFAIENPETTITPSGGGPRIVADDNLVPDVVARYNHKADWGMVSAAGIYRQLELDQGDDETRTDGWGLSVGGRLAIGKRNEVVFMGTHGSGLGRHLALNAANAVVIGSDGNLEAVDSTAGFVGLRHEWNDRWRTNLNYSAFAADHDAAISGGAVTKSADSLSINVLCSPMAQLTFGAEFMHAERELESGQSGDLDRFQFSAKYAFNFSSPGSGR